MVIKTPEDWWKLVETQWPKLHRILCNFVPVEELGKAESAKANKNWASLWTCFQHAWFAAPDSPEIHSIPGWGDLCDLCSENWVFEIQCPECRCQMMQGQEGAGGKCPDCLDNEAEGMVGGND